MSRAEFELWAKTRGWSIHKLRRGVYSDARTRGAWALRCELAAREEAS